jgi:hypothetical protein
LNLLSDIITYFRRIIKSPSDAVVSNNLIIDYINRFWIMDVDARLQLYDLKTKYQFQTAPGYDQYNMPMYALQTEPGNQTISYYPMYQGFLSPAYINGIQVLLQTEKNGFFNGWPNVVQQMNSVKIGDGGATYNFTFPIAPGNSTPLQPPFEYIIRGHVDITGVVEISRALGTFVDPPIVTNTDITVDDCIQAAPVGNVFAAVYLTSNAADGTNIVVSDSGQFLSGNSNFGILMQPGQGPNGNLPLPNPGGGVDTYSTTSNTINYFTGEVNVTFPTTIPPGVPINAQCYLFQTGLPRGMLINNNTITLRSPPDQQYLVEIDAYLSPAGFLSTGQAVPFGYMCEYIARGAARKYLSDVGDVEQFMFYEPLFKEQELLVWKRSQRQWTATRTQTLYSQGPYQGQVGFNNSSSI